MIESKQHQKMAIKSAQKGFSLIEILIALSLLALAGTFVVGQIFDSFHEGRVNSVKIQMNAFSDRLQEFKRHCHFYPTSDQGLRALVEKPTSGRECKKYNPNGYIKDGVIPLDPWDSEYQYDSDGRSFNIWSFGADQTEGGEGEDADIYLKESRNSAEQPEQTEQVE